MYLTQQDLEWVFCDSSKFWDDVCYNGYIYMEVNHFELIEDMLEFEGWNLHFYRPFFSQVINDGLQSIIEKE